MKFSRALLSAAAAVTLCSAAAPSFAVSYLLNVPVTGITYGTVDVQAVGGGVEVVVDLMAGYNFVDTGVHQLFGLNLNVAPGAVSILSPVPGSDYTFGGSFFQTGFFGSFSNGFVCNTCQGQDNSANPNNHLDFTIAGVSVGNFVANASGYTFTADVYGPDSLGGAPTTFVVGDAGGVVPGVPEPESYALMLGGLGVVGFIARRRKQQG